ncbi:MAG: M1 family aminopeptidase [Candidatus Kapaibacterium sp.]
MLRTSLILLALATICGSATAQSLFDRVTYKGARSHRFDVLHIAIDVHFDDPAREVIGTVNHTIRSLSADLAVVRLDAGENMTFSRMMVDGVPARYEHVGDTLLISLPKQKVYGDTFNISIDYRVKPIKGLYFIQPDSLAPRRRHQIWTQGEAEDNRYWVPIYDYPNDHATSEVTATVQGGWKALSNGRLVSTKNNADGTSTWHYSMEKPHASYLIMLAAGDYLVTRDSADGVPLEYWTYPDMPDRVIPTFGRTPDIIRYISRITGVPYPWNKYSQIFIANFMYGGMENTTATTLNDYALVDDRGLIDYNTDGLVAHEAAHMWYGDLVTNRSWGHLWLHESYATYLAARYNGYHQGDDAFLKEMYDNGISGVNADEQNGRDPLANGRGITPNVYQRGSRVLHMLNALVGEDMFWRSNRLYFQRMGYGNAETNDLKIAFEDATGINLDWFFDEWVYKAGYPAYKVEESYGKDSVKLRIRQTQGIDTLTGLFQMPVPIEFYLRGGVVRDTVWVAQADETFSFPIQERPRFTIFDAGDAILKTVSFRRSDEELVAQLEAPRMIDRFQAVKLLTARDSSLRDRDRLRRKSLAIRDAFLKEPSWYVRDEIVEATGVLDTNVGMEIVMKALRDPSHDVRHTAVDHSYMISDKRVLAPLLRPLLADSSYAVVSSALGMLAAVDTSGLEAILRSIKGIRGRRDKLAYAWLNAESIAQYSTLVDYVVEYVSPDYTGSTRSQALVVLSRLDTITPGARSAIVRGLTDRSPVVRSSAGIAARKHLDKDMRAMLQDLRAQLTGDEKETVDKILKN